MKVSEAFLVNTKNFEAIINTLVEHEAEEPVINSSLLEDLSFSDPNDLLVVRILKDFEVIDNDGKPSKHFEEFRNPKTTKYALAKGLLAAYEDLFERYPNIHQAQSDKIKEAFEEVFKGKKTDLIIKYISGTFQKIVSYVGTSTIDAVLEGDDAELELEASVIEEAKSSNNKNGTQSSSDNKLEASDEEVGDKNFDDIVNDFDAKKTTDNTSSDEDADLTVHEYSKDSDIEEEDEEDEDDPFDFDGMDDSTKEKEEASSKEKKNESSEEKDKSSNEKKTIMKEQQIDVDPVDLDIPLSTATQSTDTMENLTAEHNFVKKALLRKSDLLQKMQRWEELVPTLEEIIKRYDNEETKELNEAVSRSIIRRATALLKLNKTDEALSALNTVIKRFKDSDKKEFFDQASRAMLYKANLMEKNGSGDLLPLYNSIIDRLGGNSEILMKEKLDQIHLKRFDLILNKGEDAEILDASSQIIKRFKDSDEHREYLQKAMIIRAEMLDEMGHDEEALAAYDDFLSKFGS